MIKTQSISQEITKRDQKKIVTLFSRYKKLKDKATRLHNEYKKVYDQLPVVIDEINEITDKYRDNENGNNSKLPTHHRGTAQDDFE